MTVLARYLPSSGPKAEAPRLPPIEGEQTDKGKHSWELGEGELHMALKESQSVRSFVAAGQRGDY